MKLKKKLMSAVLAAIMAMSLMVPAMAGEPQQTGQTADMGETYTIDVPYEYPVVPGTNEWNVLDSHQKKLEACQIPKEILKCMTTEALVETVLHYPLRADMMVYNSRQQGYEVVKGEFNGLEELSRREDADTVLNTTQMGLAAAYENSSSKWIMDGLVLDIIREGIQSEDQVGVIPYATSGTVYTPNGTAVSVIRNRTYSDAGVTKAEVEAAEEELLAQYPSATQVSQANPAYNCHSYAWYSTSTNNTVWMSDPSAYVQDGSYVQAIKPLKGYKVLYGTGGNNPEHSGIVTAASGNVVKVDSKWGMCGVFTHKVRDCPYSKLPYYWTLAA